MQPEWFSRPVLFVADVDRALDFYVSRLGFTQNWRYEEQRGALVAQVDRQGCALIFSSQWPEKVGKGRIFVSLNVNEAMDEVRYLRVERAVNALRAEFESKGVHIEDGWWGYRLLVVRDPDGNELNFSYPGATEGPPGRL